MADKTTKKNHFNCKSRSPTLRLYHLSLSISIGNRLVYYSERTDYKQYTQGAFGYYVEGGEGEG